MQLRNGLGVTSTRPLSAGASYTSAAGSYQPAGAPAAGSYQPASTAASVSQRQSPTPAPILNTLTSLRCPHCSSAIVKTPPYKTEYWMITFLIEPWNWFREINVLHRTISLEYSLYDYRLCSSEIIHLVMSVCPSACVLPVELFDLDFSRQSTLTFGSMGLKVKVVSQRLRTNDYESCLNSLQLPQSSIVVLCQVYQKVL